MYAEIFCWKNVSSFCSVKATHLFSAKSIRILYIESTKTINEMTLNKLVKLTTLWTTGPRFFEEKFEKYLMEIPSYLELTVLTFTTLLANLANNISEYFSYFSQKSGSNISCKLSLMETICMECQNLFSGKYNKKVF